MSIPELDKETYSRYYYSFISMLGMVMLGPKGSIVVGGVMAAKITYHKIDVEYKYIKSSFPFLSHGLKYEISIMNMNFPINSVIIKTAISICNGLAGAVLASMISAPLDTLIKGAVNTAIILYKSLPNWWDNNSNNMDDHRTNTVVYLDPDKEELAGRAALDLADPINWGNTA